MVLAEVLHYVACDSRVSIVTIIPTVIVTIAPKITTFGLDSKFLSRLDNLTLLNISYSFHVKYLRKYPIIPKSSIDALMEFRFSLAAIHRYNNFFIKSYP